MKKIPAITLIFLLVAGVTISVCKPKFFADNEFLSNFINNQYVSVLAIIVTVSLVSVTQIHLEYTRLERQFKKRVFYKARDAVNSSAIILTSMLSSAFVLSFTAAQVQSNTTVVSIIFVIAMLTILESIFIMYDLVQTVCTMAADEPIEE